MRSNGLEAWIAIPVSSLLLGGSLVSLHYDSLFPARLSAANWEKVSVALWRINQAEYDFKKADYNSDGHGQFWTADVAGLYNSSYRGSKIRLIDPEIAAADICPLMLIQGEPPAPYHGYWFKALHVKGSCNGMHPDRFSIIAYPAHYGKTGRDTFILNPELGTPIWHKDLGGATITTLPDNPSEEGWSRTS